LTLPLSGLVARTRQVTLVISWNWRNHSFHRQHHQHQRLWIQQYMRSPLVTMSTTCIRNWLVVLSERKDIAQQNYWSEIAGIDMFHFFSISLLNTDGKATPYCSYSMSDLLSHWTETNVLYMSYFATLYLHTVQTMSFRPWKWCIYSIWQHAIFTYTQMITDDIVVVGNMGFVRICAANSTLRHCR